MSASGKSRSKRGPHKLIKLPEGATPVPEISPESSDLLKDLDKNVIDLCEDLIKSDWQAFNVRPPRDLFGIYIICKWYAREKQWVILYASRGHVRNRLDGNFSGKQRTPIANYLSSYPKEARGAIWIKWIKDPYYPYETVNMEDLVKGLSAYNNNEKPAFNIEKDELVSEEVPENFSIIPDWSKGQPTSKKQPRSSFFP